VKNKNTYAVYNRSLINVGFAELKGKPLNTSFQSEYSSKNYTPFCKQAYLLDIAVPNSHNITQTYNTKINKYLELSVAMRNLWCLEKISILPFIISAGGETPVIMLISTALLLDSIIRNSVCTPAKLPCRRVEVG
jgi:hypothetical protein